MTTPRNFILLLPVMFAVSGCSVLGQGEAKYPTGADRNTGGSGNEIYEDSPSIFGDGGFDLLGTKKKAGPGEDGVAVNGYLWRAALDTVSFMPLASADPFGGTIITDWYTDPSTPNERTKLNVFVLGRELKADAISVKVFRQVRGGGGWKDANVAKETATKLEDAILTRAREMRIAADE